MITFRHFKTACGGDFVTRKHLAEVLRYRNPQSVDKYLDGLEKIGGTRYFTEDVWHRIQEAGLH